MTAAISIAQLRNLARARGFDLRRVREEHTHREVLYRDTHGTRRYVAVMVRPGSVAGWLERELDEARRALDAAPRTEASRHWRYA